MKNEDKMREMCAKADDNAMTDKDWADLDGIVDGYLERASTEEKAAVFKSLKFKERFGFEINDFLNG